MSVEIFQNDKYIGTAKKVKTHFHPPSKYFPWLREKYSVTANINVDSIELIGFTPAED